MSYLDNLINKLQEKVEYYQQYVSEAFLNENVNGMYKRKNNSEDYYKGRLDSLNEVLKYLNKMPKEQSVNNRPQPKSVNESMYGPDFRDMEVLTPDSLPNGQGGYQLQRWEDVKKPKSMQQGMAKGMNTSDAMQNAMYQQAEDDTDLDDYWYKDKLDS